MKIGIAGGIGSGKSYVARLLKQHGITVYDCDSAAKRLMREDPQLRQQLTDLIGPDCYLCDKPQEANEADKAHEPQKLRLNKAAVSRFLLASDDNAQAINAIVHPAVFADFEQSGLQWLESGIMYESGANRYVDRVVVVTAPEEVRISRIMQRDHINRQQALEWMQRQWSQDEVRRRADYEIVNDGTTDINEQIEKLLEAISRNIETSK